MLSIPGFWYILFLKMLAYNKLIVLGNSYFLKIKTKIYLIWGLIVYTALHTNIIRKHLHQEGWCCQRPNHVVFWNKIACQRWLLVLEYSTICVWLRQTYVQKSDTTRTQWQQKPSFGHWNRIITLIGIGNNFGLSIPLSNRWQTKFVVWAFQIHKINNNKYRHCRPTAQDTVREFY